MKTREDCDEWVEGAEISGGRELKLEQEGLTVEIDILKVTSRC